MEHNWNPGEFTCCLTCGCFLFDIHRELTERAKAPCPGRTPEFQAHRDAVMARLHELVASIKGSPDA